MQDNRLEFAKTPSGKIRAMVRSDQTADTGANIDDPTAAIITIATLAGLKVTVENPAGTDGGNVQPTEAG